DQQQDFMRGRDFLIQGRGDMIISISNPELWNNGKIDQAPEGILEAVKSPDFKPIKESEISRDVKGDGSSKSGFQHKSRFELCVFGEVKNISPCQEVVLFIGSEFIFISIFGQVKIIVFQHIGHRKPNVIFIGIIIDPRANVQEGAIRVFTKSKITGIDDM